MQLIGRMLQYAGLVALPAAILIELTGVMGEDFGLSQMLVMMVFGFCAFHLGRYIEGYSQPQ